MEFYSKIKWILGILLVFVLIVTTNLIDRSNFIQVKDSLITIYEDRLIADEMIFEMSNLFHEKEVAVLTSDTLFYSRLNGKVDTEINGFINRFQRTKLTKEEFEVFDNLKTNFKDIKNAESNFIQSKFTKKETVEKHLKVNKEILYSLSKIQSNEGGRQWSISKNAINTIGLFRQMEIYLLALLAIIVQIIILHKPTGQESDQE